MKIISIAKWQLWGRLTKETTIVGIRMVHPRVSIDVNDFSSASYLVQIGSNKNSETKKFSVIK